MLLGTLDRGRTSPLDMTNLCRTPQAGCALLAICAVPTAGAQVSKGVPTRHLTNLQHADKGLTTICGTFGC